MGCKNYFLPLEWVVDGTNGPNKGVNRRDGVAVVVVVGSVLLRFEKTPSHCYRNASLYGQSPLDKGTDVAYCLWDSTVWFVGFSRRNGRGTGTTGLP